MDRMHFGIVIDPTATGTLPDEIELLRDVIETEVENEAGQISLGDPANTGEVAWPFDETKPVRLEDGEDRAAYYRTVRHLQLNPVEATKLIFSANRAATLKRLVVQVRRLTPFDKMRGQEIPLTALLKSDALNDCTIEVPLTGVILDGWTHIVVKVKSAPEDVERVDLVVETGAMDDVRRGLK